MDDNVIFSGAPEQNVYGPLTAGQLFERTFGLLRENFKLFFGIALVIIGIEIVVGVVLGGTGLWIGRSAAVTAPIIKVLFIMPLALVGLILIYIFTQVTQGALFIATEAKLMDAVMSVGEACRLAASHAGRLIGISLLVMLRIFGYMLLVYFLLAIPMFVVLFAGHATAAFRSHSAPAGLAGAGIFSAACLAVFLIVCALALMWLFARYALSIPASLAENLPVTDAIRRSISLSRGSKGRLYALFLAAFCLGIAVIAVIFPVQLMVAHVNLMHMHSAPAATGVGSILLDIVENVVNAIIFTVVGVATSLCYFDLRVRKEGFGLVTAVVAVPPQVSPALPDWPIEDLPVS